MHTHLTWLSQNITSDGAHLIGGQKRIVQHGNIDAGSVCVHEFQCIVNHTNYSVVRNEKVMGGD